MEDSLSDSLQVARESLLRGVKRSKQGAFNRRAPETDSLPHFGQARQLLEAVLKQDPANRQALLLMSQLSESLLNYEAAESFLSRAFEAGEPKTKKSLRRLALLRQSSVLWKDLLLTPDAVRELGRHLRSAGVGPSHTTMRLTREWLEANRIHDPDEVIAALARRGAFSDFQVLANVVYG